MLMQIPPGTSASFQCGKLKKNGNKVNAGCENEGDCKKLYLVHVHRPFWKAKQPNRRIDDGLENKISNKELRNLWQ